LEYRRLPVEAEGQLITAVYSDRLTVSLGFVQEVNIERYGMVIGDKFAVAADSVCLRLLLWGSRGNHLLFFPGRGLVPFVREGLIGFLPCRRFHGSFKHISFRADPVSEENLSIGTRTVTDGGGCIALKNRGTCQYKEDHHY
jgi:hypothetical protein